MIEKKINYRRVLDFLEHKNSKIPDNLELLIKEVIKEIIEIGQVKFCHLTVDRNLVPDEQIKKNILFALTLGAAVDNRILYYEKTYVTKAIIADAAANVMMENAIEQLEKYLQNLYERDTFYLTEIMCPGNQDIPLEWNKRIVDILDAQKRIGVHITEHYGLLPQKSVVGFFGVTEHQICKKGVKCENCTANCKFRKKSVK